MANIIFDGDIEYPPEYSASVKEEDEEKLKAKKKKAKAEEPKDE